MNIRILRQPVAIWMALASPIVAGSFDVPAANKALAQAIYGLESQANSISSLAVSVDSGVVKMDLTLRNDRGETYPAFLRIPFHYDLKNEDLRGAKAITFEYRNSTRITDLLEVSLESPKYPAAAIYTLASLPAEIAYSNSIAADTLLAPTVDGKWKSVTLEIPDFQLPAWWSVPEDFPTLDSILAQVTSLRFTPKTSFDLSGWPETGCHYANCGMPTMGPLTLELRNIQVHPYHCEQGWPGEGLAACNLLLGEAKSALGVRSQDAFVAGGLSWHRGKLSIDHPSQWSSAALVGIDGRVIRSLARVQQQTLDLSTGTYRVVLQGPGRVASNTFTVVR